jgi:hypothetical protein
VVAKASAMLALEFEGMLHLIDGDDLRPDQEVAEF